MEKLWNLPLGDLPLFILTLFRVSGVVLLAPLFGSGVVPARVRALLSLGLAVVFFPQAVSSGEPIQPSVGGLVQGAFFELSVGLLIGFTAAMLFAAVQFGGQIIDQELGIMLANVLDPISNEQVSIIGQFKVFLATVVYLLIDGHHQLLQAVGESFRTVPIAGMRFRDGLAWHLSDTLMRDMFRMAVQIAAPALVTLFLITVALAFMARTVPELNIFVLGFSLRVLVGLLVLALGVGIFITGFQEMSLHHADALRKMIGFLGA
jgi:flagellar biosynthetic protein FliR